MAKKLIALALCLCLMASVFVGCSSKDENDLGAHIRMYLTDMVYDFDPAYAYINESNLRVISLLFDNLFVLDEDGEVVESLVEDYEITEDEKLGEYKMFLELRDGACWTDGTPVTANDVVFTWKRVLEVGSSYEVASLLFDVKNARAVKEGDATIDDLGVYALNESTVEVVFEGKINYDQFLLNLTSYALVPLRENVVTRTADWAKKPATISTSGPFRIREISYEKENPHIILERNPYYYRNFKEDPVDESVTPYRLIIDFSMTADEIMAAYNNGEIFYVGDIPLSVRSTYKDKAQKTDALSTHSYIFNTNAEINGTKLFADARVRKALSLVINRQAIADAVVFAKAATGLVPYGVFEADSADDLFREVGGALLATGDNLAEAQNLIAQAGINPRNFSFSISVAAYDEVHMMIANMVKEAWCKLGFKVTVKPIDTTVNDEKHEATDEVPKDIRDDEWAEQYMAGKFEVVAIDFTAFSADAYSVLSRFAKAFSGQGMDMSDPSYNLTPHLSGYDSEAYNAKMEEVFAEKDIEKRAALLHDAEKILMEDMPIVPIVFNQNAVLISDELSKVEATYYCPAIFTKTELDNYLEHIPVTTEEEATPAA